MADDDQETFESSSSGAADTTPAQCSSLRKNGFVVIKNRPCKIVEMSTSKTGKHGHAKVHLVGIDIFNGKKYEDICPSTHNMNVPNVTRQDYDLCDINEGFLTYMDEKGAECSDLKLPESDVGKELTAEFEAGKALTFTVLRAMGEEAVVALKSVD